MAKSGHITGCHRAMEVVSGGQGYCKAPYRAGDSPPRQRPQAPNGGCAELQKPALNEFDVLISQPAWEADMVKSRFLPGKRSIRGSVCLWHRAWLEGPSRAGGDSEMEGLSVKTEYPGHPARLRGRFLAALGGADPLSPRPWGLQQATPFPWLGETRGALVCCHPQPRLSPCPRKFTGCLHLSLLTSCSPPQLAPEAWVGRGE